MRRSAERRAAVRRRRRSGWRRAVRNPALATGLGLLLAFLLLALAHPVLTATVWADEQIVYRPVAGFDATIATHPSGPSLRHLLGTDALGRDVLSVLMVALRPTLVTAAVAATVLGVSAVLASTVAAYFQRKVDTVVSLVADALILLPAPVVIILGAIAFPESLGPVPAGALYGILAGLSSATIVLRSQALAVMAKPFIQASRIAGGGAWHTIRTHLLPHVIPLAVVQMMAGVVGVIIATGFAQYIVHPDDSLGLGTMIYSGLTYQGFVAGAIAWNTLLAGALSITLMAAAFYLIGFGIRQLVDPAHVSRQGGRAAPVALAVLLLAFAGLAGCRGAPSDRVDAGGTDVALEPPAAARLVVTGDLEERIHLPILWSVGFVSLDSVPEGQDPFASMEVWPAEFQSADRDVVAVTPERGLRVRVDRFSFEADLEACAVDTATDERHRLSGSISCQQLRGFAPGLDERPVVDVEVEFLVTVPVCAGEIDMEQLERCYADTGYDPELVFRR